MLLHLFYQGVEQHIHNSRLHKTDKYGTCSVRKQPIEVLDKMLKDINDSKLPFGSKVIVFSGVFRQVLHVIHKGTRQEHIDISLASSYLCSILCKIKLIENKQD